MARRLTSSINVVLIIWLANASTVSRCWADEAPSNGEAVETPSNKDVELGRLQFRGMLDSRKRLSSGVFRGIEKEYSEQFLDDSHNQQKAQHVFCAFDFQKNWMRFDRDTGKTMAGKRGAAKEDINIPLRGKYVRRPEHTLRWSTSGIHDVVRGKATAPPPDIVSPFDVRCVGILFNSVMEGLEIRGLGFDKICDHIISNVHIVEVSHEANGICRVVWSLQPPRNDKYDMLITTWFNQAYLPIRQEGRFAATQKLISKMEVTWQQMADVWVPRTYKGEDFSMSPGDSGLRRKRELVFEWESVNESLPEKYFTVAGLDLPGDTLVSSDELGKFVTLGTIADKEATIAGKEAALPELKENRTRPVLVVVSLVLMVILTIAIIVHRRRCQTKGYT